MEEKEVVDNKRRITIYLEDTGSNQQIIDEFLKQYPKGWVVVGESDEIEDTIDFLSKRDGYVDTDPVLIESNVVEMKKLMSLTKVKGPLWIVCYWTVLHGEDYALSVHKF